MKRERISTGQVIKLIHPMAGSYQINYFVNYNANFTQDTSQNKSLGVPTSSDSVIEKGNPEVYCCVVCGNKKTYTIADCGCSLCAEHFKMIKNTKYLNHRIKCRVHNVYLTSNLCFEMTSKSKIKGNALHKLGLPKCPVCKINDGTQSFNCGCPMRVCENCFNDNVYVFKYNQCPGCGKQYTPIQKMKKSKT